MREIVNAVPRPDGAPMTTIRHELEVTRSPEDVYRALTTPSGLQGWWSRDCTCGDGSAGEHEMRFRKGGRTVVMRFRVDALDPGRLVAWRCVQNDNPVWPGTTLRWELAATPRGTKIAFTHAGFAE